MIKMHANIRGNTVTQCHV